MGVIPGLKCFVDFFTICKDTNFWLINKIYFLEEGIFVRLFGGDGVLKWVGGEF